MIVVDKPQRACGLAYYAFDNAVLWAAFHAYGHTPPVSIIIMGYLIGSLTGALPRHGTISQLTSRSAAATPATEARWGCGDRCELSITEICFAVGRSSLSAFSTRWTELPSCA